MLSKNQIKLINQLKQKKYRKKHQLFFVEGIKSVKEFLASNFKLYQLYATADVLYAPKDRYQLISSKELKKISALKNPQTVLGIFEIPKFTLHHQNGLYVALDGVRDPGNLGTIIRLCDWFGVEQLVCSSDTVDCFNPKTIQASMGSLARVTPVYTDLAAYLSQSQLPVFGTFMQGEPLYQQQLPQAGILVMGNEGHGISSAVNTQVTRRLSIPQFGENKATESLNVATATAIVLSEFRRK